MSETPQVRFPPKRASQGPALALPRRHAQTRSPFYVSEASAAARESIRAIVSATRAPFASGISIDQARVTDLERTLRQLELALAERERIVEELEARAVERERDMAEAEALLGARESLLAAIRRPAQSSLSPEEREALERLRAELEKQEATVMEARESLKAREQFLDESESKLFEKVQAQQEKEIEQDQRDEDLRARERRLREREAAIDPAAAAELRASDEAAKKRDEFNE